MNNITFGKKKSEILNETTNFNCTKKTNIKFITYKNMCGISIALFRYLNSISNQYNCNLYNCKNYKTDTKNDITIIFRVCDKDTENMIKFEKMNKKKVIGIFVWELHTIHKEFLRVCKQYDHIIVPSLQLNTLFKQYDFNNISTIRHALPMEYTVKPNVILSNLKKDKRFKFYSICTNSYRKNVNALILGFQNFIKNTSSDAILILKIDSIPKNINKTNNIFFITEFVTESELNYLHLISDCYLCTSYSEGVNLPMIDAAIFNNFIISSHFGGSIEYFPFSFSISSLLTKNNDDYFYFDKSDIWMEIDLMHYEELLNYVYNNKNNIKDILPIQQKHIKQICNISTIQKQLYLVIEDILL